MDQDLFIEELKKLGINVTGRQLDQLNQYRILLKEKNKVMNLTGIDDDAGIWLKHFFDSSLLLPLLGGIISLCDVGSGAGFPGIVLAILDPSLQVTCLEPLQKRCGFLNEVIGQTRLINCRVVCGRAEEYARNHREAYDAVTARAVANLAILSELCLPLVKVQGRFIAMKGPQASEEIKSAEHAIRVLGGSVKQVHIIKLLDQSYRVNIEIEKISSTDTSYPRTYGKIKKNHL